MLLKREDIYSISSPGSSMYILGWIAKETVKCNFGQVEKINLKLTEMVVHDILIIKMMVCYACRSE